MIRALQKIITAEVILNSPLCTKIIQVAWLPWRQLQTCPTETWLSGLLVLTHRVKQADWSRYIMTHSIKTIKLVQRFKQRFNKRTWPSVYFEDRILPPVNVFSSVSSKCLRVAFSGGVRNTLVTKFITALKRPKKEDTTLTTTPSAIILSQSGFIYHIITPGLLQQLPCDNSCTSSHTDLSKQRWRFIEGSMDHVIRLSPAVAFSDALIWSIQSIEPFWVLVQNNQKWYWTNESHQNIHLELNLFTQDV